MKIDQELNSGNKTMKKTLLTFLALALAGTAIAQSLPSYYPTKGFPHTGRIDAVYAGEDRVVIDDKSYVISDSAIVRSLSSDDDSMARIRAGAHVGYKTSGNRVIVEFWLLPKNYDASRRR